MENLKKEDGYTTLLDYIDLFIRWTAYRFVSCRINKNVFKRTTIS